MEHLLIFTATGCSGHHCRIYTTNQPYAGNYRSFVTAGFAAQLSLGQNIELIGSGFLKTRNLTLLTLLP